MVLKASARKSAPARIISSDDDVSEDDDVIEEDKTDDVDLTNNEPREEEEAEIMKLIEKSEISIKGAEAVLDSEEVSLG